MINILQLHLDSPEVQSAKVIRYIPVLIAQTSSRTNPCFPAQWSERWSGDKAEREALELGQTRSDDTVVAMVIQL